MFLGFHDVESKQTRFTWLPLLSALYVWCPFLRSAPEPAHTDLLLKRT